MKKYLKILLLVLVLSISAVIMVGCGNDEKPVYTESEQNELITSVVPITQDEGVKEKSYSLVSSEDRLVFLADDSYEVYYFEDGKILKVEVAKKYETEGMARQIYTQMGGIENTKIRYVDNVYIETMDESYYDIIKEYSKDELTKFMENENYILVK